MPEAISARELELGPFFGSFPTEEQEENDSIVREWVDDNCEVPLTQLEINKANGAEQEREDREMLQKEGRKFEEARSGIKTPYGWRYADHQEVDENGKIIRYFESKFGNSPYGGTTQAKKDEWIWKERGIPTIVLRNGQRSNEGWPPDRA